MAENTLDQVQRLVDQLAPLDQVRLLEYLAPRIAQVVAGSRLAGPVLTLANAEARAEFLRVAMRLRTATQARGTP